jgi:transcriptional regulator with XRE-family HTH domain
VSPAAKGGAPKTALHRAAPRFRRVAALLARRVKDLRAARRWTIEAAAERIGIEPAHVGRIESARANPSLAVLVSVATAFGLTVSELLAQPPPKRDSD